MVQADGSPEGAAALLSAIVAARRRPTVVLCFSNRSGFNALAAAGAVGVRVPDDLSVVAFDDTLACQLSTLPLAAVAQDSAGLGRTATRQLVTLLAGHRLAEPRILLPARLVPRASLAPPPPAA
jgi:DNA-binding LacI/PurR family transcriptional regulator